MTPLAGTAVFPPGWQEHHQPAVETALPDQVTITRDTGGSVYDPDTDDYVPTRDTITAAAPALIQRVTAQTQQVEMAGQVIAGLGYLVQIPLDAGDVRRGDVIHVDQSGSPSLAGQDLVVLSVPGESLQWLLDIVASDNLADTP